MNKHAWQWILVGFLAFVGFLDAFYLSYAHYMQDPLVCNLLDGCNVVAKSPYSKILGVPIAYLGVVYYLGMIKMIFWKYYIPTLSALGEHLFVWGAYSGAVVSAFFVYIQYAYIGAFCIYCLLSAVITWLIAGFVVYIQKVHSLTTGNHTTIAQ